MNLKDLIYKQRNIANTFKTKWINNMSLDLKNYLSTHTKQDLLININKLFEPARYYSILNNLWDDSYNLGNTTRNIYKFSLSDNLFNIVEFTEKDTAKRKTKGELYAQSQNISTTNFGNNYLKYREQYIFSNFVPTYRNTIRYKIKNYIETPNADESILYDALKPQWMKDKTPIEIENYAKMMAKDKEFMTEHNLKYGDTVGLIKAIRDNPRKYDKFGHYLDLDNRVDRIAQTEVSQAYNLGVISESIKKGNRYFMWNSSIENLVSKGKRCTLCSSLHGKIIDLTGSITPTGKSSWNMDFKSLYELYGQYTRKTFIELPNFSNPVPSIHPFCGCSLIVLDNKEKVNSLFSTLTQNRSNTKEQIKQVLDYVGLSQPEKDKSLLGSILTAALVGTVAVKGVDVAKQISYDLVLEQKKKEEQRRKQKMIIIGSSILTTGVMMYFFYKNMSKAKILDDIVEEIIPTEKLSAKVIKGIETTVDNAKEVAEELKEHIISEVAENVEEGIEEGVDILKLDALYNSTKSWLTKATESLEKVVVRFVPYIQRTHSALEEWQNILIRLGLTSETSNSSIVILQPNLRLSDINISSLDSYTNLDRIKELTNVKKLLYIYDNQLININKEFKNINETIIKLQKSYIARDTALAERIEICKNSFSEDDKRLNELLVLYSIYEDVKNSLNQIYQTIKQDVRNNLDIYKIAVKDIKDLGINAIIEQDKLIHKDLQKAIRKLQTQITNNEQKSR